MTASAPPEKSAEEAKPKATLALPLLLVIVLAIALFWALEKGGQSNLPSVLVGQPIPQFDLAPIPRLVSDSRSVPGLSSSSFRKGEVSLLNFWASWCAPCQAEQPELLGLARRGIPLYGVNYKDKPEAARRFLARLGNPFRALGADDSGFTGIDFGITGVPETFVIDGDGRIAYRYAGPMTPQIVADEIMPAIDAARRRTARPRY